MKTVCIYHSIDLDGWMSAAIVQLWWNNSPKAIDNNDDKLDFIGYNYGDPIPNLSEYDKVIMCDISFPKKDMNELWNNFRDNFIWIDHHISSIIDNSSYVMEYDREVPFNYKGIRDTRYAACELTWQYFFPNETMPEIVRLLGRYDCFGSKGTDEELKVLEFQYGARQIISDYETAYIHLYDSLKNNREAGNLIRDIILNQGAAIYSYLCIEAKQVYKNGFEIQFYWAEDIGRPNGNPKQCNAKFICINKVGFNPINFGIDYHKDGYDGAACFHYANGMWNFSLYNDNGKVDCSVIAKQFGGGGHKGTAGFRIKDINLIIT